MKTTVYVAGPYTSPDPITNTRDACAMGDQLVKHGFVPLVPHQTLIWHAMYPHEVDYWYALDLDIMRECADCVLRLPGASHGADREVEEAERLGLPVFHSLDELIVCDVMARSWQGRARHLMRLRPFTSPSRVLAQHHSTRTEFAYVHCHTCRNAVDTGLVQHSGASCTVGELTITCKQGHEHTYDGSEMLWRAL